MGPNLWTTNSFDFCTEACVVEATLFEVDIGIQREPLSLTGSLF